MQSYKTILNESTITFIEKKSKFISFASQIQSEKEANYIINKIKKNNTNANHNIFAYSVGLKNEILKCSDDGEPSNTAGTPTLSVIKNNNLKNCIIVTTRYFGGTLLGTGGLIRSYGKSATLVIDKAKIITNTLFDIININCDYKLSEKINYILKEKKIKIVDISYTEYVQFNVLVKSFEFESFKNELINYTNDKCEITKIGEKYSH